MLVLGLVAPLIFFGQSQAPLRFYSDIGRYHRPTNSPSALAKKYVDQGFAALYGFEYGFAEKSFEQAASLDSELVIAHWGVAASQGNTINWTGVSAEKSKKALAALDRARQNRAKGSPVENDLVDASMRRFSASGPADRHLLDKAYSDAMRTVWSKYPDDADVGALFAESLMNMHPWNHWTMDGKPQPDTEEAMAAIQASLRLNPNHPEALHLWVHVTEGSKEPQRANREANRLLDLMPGVYHLQHMPAHTFNRSGNWSKAIEANQKSISVYHRIFGRKENVLDYAHARHSLAYAAGMKGMSELALAQCNAIFNGTDTALLASLGGNGDYYYSMRIMFLIRFGMWKQALAMPEPPATYKFSIAIRHEARAVSFAAQKDIASALDEQAKYEAAKVAALNGETDTGTIGQLQLMSHLVSGEIFAAQGKFDQAAAELRLAVNAEDALPYQEPPNWIVPTRQTLGAALLEGGKFAEAVKAYEDDLAIHPANGWDLVGLSRAFKSLGKLSDADKKMAEFKRAWAEADIDITSSCMCMPGKKG